MKPSLQKILTQFKGVIFDLDGTLVDSMWMWRAIDVEYLARFGYELPDDYQKSIEGLSFHEVAVYTKERFHIPDDPEKMKQDWNDMALECYETRVPVKPGVRQFLNELRKAGIRMGIATSNSRTLLETVLGAQKIRPYFDVIATGCEVEHGKPFPDIYLHVAEGLGVKPSDCLVFEDVEAGIRAAVAAGMSVCTVYDPFSESSQETLKEQSDYYIRSYEELFDENSEG
ncbi:MAG: HAD family phosphatase [Lachnospiraceae bacterium]|nr:HAD family phosphatase [Lachnospiraceae bacterium]